MWPLTKSAASSRVGQLLCLVMQGLVSYFYFFGMSVPSAHATPPIYSVGNGGFIAGRWVDFDSSLFPVLILSNLLPLLISNLVIDLVVDLFPRTNVITASWVYACLFLTLISMQWLIVGSFIEKMVKLYQDSRPQAPHLTRG
jgi:hypothetical protein